MNINLKFEESDFKSFRNFEKAMQKRLNTLGIFNAYVGTNSISFHLEYPPELADMIRPCPKKTQLEFELKSEKHS